MTGPEAPPSVRPHRLQQCRWPRCTLAGGLRLAGGRAPSVLVFSHGPVATAWGRCGRGPRRPRRARSEAPVTSAQPPTAHLCAWSLGCPWEGAGRGGRTPVTILSARSARRPCLWGAACPACVPGSPGPAVRCLGRPAVPGGPGCSVDSPCHPGPQHSGSCCRPEATWPRGCGPRAGNSDQRLPPCSVPWLLGAQAPFSPTFGGVAGARAQAHFLARHPRALPLVQVGAPPPPLPSSPPVGRSWGCAQLRPPRGAGLSSPGRCPAGPALLPGPLCPAPCWAPGAHGAGTVATFWELI